MFNYNDDNIFSGYIKQLLSSFNLPTFKCWNPGDFIVENKLYLYNNKLLLSKTKGFSNKETDFDIMKHYSFNDSVLNYTKNLKIKSNIYDSYTHTYLGNYLRFIRDYKKMNLMSMYNCFSNEYVNNLDITINNTIKFNNEPNYKIYKIPIKLFNTYTIAIESSQPIELVCALYDKVQYNTKDISNFQLIEQTYTKIRSSSFSKPFLFSKLSKESLKELKIIDVASLVQLVNKESMLYLFIKVPFVNKSSISVLEGNYLDYNDFTFSTNDVGPMLNYNSSIINLDNNSYNNVPKLISQLQLLYINSNISHPFADKLIEYLIRNTVDCCETTSDNIKRIQANLHNKYDTKNISSLYNYTDDYGIWSNKYQSLLYCFAKDNGLLNTKQDILGYLDKDIEKQLGDINIYDEFISSSNVSSVNK
jgi:hypothetical protein